MKPLSWKCLAVVCLLVSSVALAEPVGPYTTLPGFTAEQSRLTYDEGVRILGDAEREQGKRLSPGSRGFFCAVAQMMQGAVEAAGFHQRGSLTAAQVKGAKRALAFLADVQARYCDRPPGGGMGSGNEGDALVKAFADRHAPKQRSRLEEVREWLGEVLGVAPSSPAQDAALVAAMALAGALALPSLAVP